MFLCFFVQAYKSRAHRTTTTAASARAASVRVHTGDGRQLLQRCADQPTDQSDASRPAARLQFRFLQRFAEYIDRVHSAVCGCRRTAAAARANNHRERGHRSADANTAGEDRLQSAELRQSHCDHQYTVVVVEASLGRSIATATCCRCHTTAAAVGARCGETTARSTAENSTANPRWGRRCDVDASGAAFRSGSCVCTVHSADRRRLWPIVGVGVVWVVVLVDGTIQIPKICKEIRALVEQRWPTTSSGLCVRLDKQQQQQRDGCSSADDGRHGSGHWGAAADVAGPGGRFMSGHGRGL